MIITHRWLSILEGCLLVALGIHLLNSSHLLISGTAGMGLIVQHLSTLSFGQLFFILNLPFYLLAIRCMGRAFTVRTFISVSLLSLLSELMRRYLDFNIAEPVLAAVLGGMLVGFGLIILFRHQSSLGGLNILAMYLERRFGIHAGKTTLVGDILIVSVAFFVFEPAQVLYSLVAFLFMSSVVGRYHRPPTWARVQTA
ncbi:membrane protein [Pokkaliibacter plantistimulans]|uniref:Membrane protein n=1 Tax=Proteobacteria bacterium 228 TaxID=2083153 RepID=A0A2S5KVR9_9PROT|nr:YitT family protein [Pokkaliibacter plantistimulans]PPC78742.1 membrane protein [Pokkaliibacter plantistimulans]